jgi:hypothetical protein
MTMSTITTTGATDTSRPLPFRPVARRWVELVWLDPNGLTVIRTDLGDPSA